MRFLKTHKEIGTEIGALVDEKNVAYGNSFNESGQILLTLFPEGIPPEKYNDMLFITRVIDKLFRIANDKKDYNNENPARDIAGYAILKVRQDC